MKESTIKLIIPITLTTDDISGLLSSAFEGGSSYWYCDLEPDEYPPGKGPDDFRFYHVELPLVGGGSVKFRDSYEPDDSAVDDDGYYRLDLDKIETGLRVFIEKYPQQWADFSNGNYDAYTGDVFLQCCIFGEAIYG